MPAIASKLYDRALTEAKKTSPDFSKVRRLLEKSHEGGDLRAAYALGTWFLHGHFVEQNLRKAIQLIRLAASANVPEALFDLAVSFELGNGVAKSNEKAALHYLRSAVYGDNQAIFEVGRCFYYGIGFGRNRKVAKIWLDRANDLGTYEATGGQPRRTAAGVKK